MSERERADGAQAEPPEAAGEPGVEAQEAPAAPAPAGGIQIGTLSGGAVAAGTDAQAEDRSRRMAVPPPPPAPPDMSGAVPPPPPAPLSGAPIPPPPVPGGISIGEMSGGAAAQGTRARAVDASVPFADSAAAAQLAAAVRELRAALVAQPRTDELDAVERELVRLEDEAREGRSADRSRLTWLRERLELGQIAAAGGASGVAVVEGIARLLG